jgi:hypothetical protein
MLFTVCCHFLAWLTSTLKMESIYISEISYCLQTTQFCNPEDRDSYRHRCDILKWRFYSSLRIVWMWELFPTFRRYILPPTSASKYAGRVNVQVYIDCFYMPTGEGQGLLPLWAIKNAGQRNSCFQGDWRNQNCQYFHFQGVSRQIAWWE